MKFNDTLVIGPKENNPRNSEGAYITLKDGRIMFIYSYYVGESWNDDAFAQLVAIYSDDQGKTWTPDHKVVLRDDSSVNVMSVSLLRLQDGRIMMTYLKKAVSSMGSVGTTPLTSFSCDEGETWSEPKSFVPFEGYHVLNNDRLVQLQDGRILIPVAWHRLREVGFDSRAITLIFISDDNGETFREASDWLLPPNTLDSGLQEPGVIELEPNHILCWNRTSDGCQYVSHSYDNGEHWTSSVPSEFKSYKSYKSPLSMKRNPKNGELIVVWNDVSGRWSHLPEPDLESSWGRTPLTIAFSRDNGVTWVDHTILEDNPKRGYCYTAMHFTDDNALLLGFCFGGDEGTTVLQEMKFKRIELD